MGREWIPLCWFIPQYLGAKSPGQGHFLPLGCLPRTRLSRGWTLQGGQDTPGMAWLLYPPTFQLWSSKRNRNNLRHARDMDLQSGEKQNPRDSCAPARRKRARWHVCRKYLNNVRHTRSKRLNQTAKILGKKPNNPINPSGECGEGHGGLDGEAKCTKLSNRPRGGFVGQVGAVGGGLPGVQQEELSGAVLCPTTA